MATASHRQKLARAALARIEQRQMWYQRRIDDRLHALADEARRLFAAGTAPLTLTPMRPQRWLQRMLTETCASCEGTGATSVGPCPDCTWARTDEPHTTGPIPDRIRSALEA